MAKLNNDNWVYEDERAYARSAEAVLNRVKEAKKGKRYKHIIISDAPLTIIEKEDPEGKYYYGEKNSEV